MKSSALVGLYGAGLVGRSIGQAFAQPFVFVDDTPEKQGTCIDGHDVVSLEQFASTPASRHQLYICIYQPRFSWERKREQILQQYPSLNVNSFADLFVSSSIDTAYAFFEPADVLKQKLERYTQIAPLLEDALSRQTLDAHLQFRLTGQFEKIVWTSRRDVPFLVAALQPDVTYVDAGAFDGDTAEDFLALSGGRFSRIQIVEPDVTNLARARARMTRLGILDRVEFHAQAIMDTRGMIGFNERGREGSSVDPMSEHKVEAVMLSDFDAPGQLYVKLDIEGAETAALRASRDFIAARRPLLAISVYHRPDDLMDIAEGFVDAGYALYLRCHGEAGGDDLMLYALPRSA
ncbi:FkbM family methyltransferase [Paraburkholderia dinghuensis]|uniref:FkbM family methyltransferase n=1 Tax=Paraburkholderia dinghuensis TaxID=2305225 RepID=UPI00162455B8|nr:FkbM family methyltransferase [Paraburkholderia dinghuensis]